MEGIDSADALADHLRAGRDEINRRVRKGEGGLDTAREHSDLVDSVIRRMLEIACLRTGRSVESIPLAIVATGGYGRRELCPHSDIDITFVPQRDGIPIVDRAVKEMFTMVMSVFIDSNRMSVGYAYRLFEDFGALDHQTTCGLLDARHIAGSDRIFLALEHDFWAFLNPAEFIFTKLDERRRQREKAGSTPRMVEPNLKDGAGGLRDLQAAVWVTQARLGLPAARVRGDRSLAILEQEGGISSSERSALADAKEHLFRIRSALHVITGVERDELVVTRQEEVAELLGFSRTGVADARSDTPPPPSPEAAPPVETFMRGYYEAASTIDRICMDVMRRAENSRLFLGIGLDCSRREVTPANSSLLTEDPVWMLWACEMAQRYELELSDELCRAIVLLMGRHPETRDFPQAAEVFRQILTSPRGAYPTLKRMADLGILGWLIPELAEVMNLIPYDPSHDYTVGQHSLIVIRFLDTLRGPTQGDDPFEFRRVMAEISHPEQVYLAALLHDAGKASANRPHSEAGEELAAHVCARMGWDAEAGGNVRFLVRQHLLMAETSRLRDLNLEETIRDFAAIIGDMDRLRMLYVLTWADTCAVADGIWTQLKGRFMHDLLRRTERSLAALESESPDDPGLTRTRRRLMKELAVENLPAEDVSDHVESMPATYILNTSLQEMALHVGMVRRARLGEPVIDFHDDRDSTYTEVTVCALDDPQPGLLSKIAGVLYSADTDVHSAQVFTRVAGSERIAIDTLYVDFRGRRLTPGKRNELAAGLTAVLTGRTTVADLLVKRKKNSEIGGSVSKLNLRNDLSDIYTVVEVSSPDERGMLYRASGALSTLHWDIHSARLSHFKGLSAASFYVSGPRSMSLQEARDMLLRQMPLA